MNKSSWNEQMFQCQYVSRVKWYIFDIASSNRLLSLFFLSFTFSQRFHSRPFATPTCIPKPERRSPLLRINPGEAFKMAFIGRRIRHLPPLLPQTNSRDNFAFHSAISLEVFWHRLQMEAAASWKWGERTFTSILSAIFMRRDETKYLRNSAVPLWTIGTLCSVFVPHMIIASFLRRWFRFLDPFSDTFSVAGYMHCMRDDWCPPIAGVGVCVLVSGVTFVVKASATFFPPSPPFKARFRNKCYYYLH